MVIVLVVSVVLYSVGAIVVFDLWNINKRSTTKERVLAYVSSALFPVTLLIAIVICVIEVVKEKRK